MRDKMERCIAARHSNDSINEGIRRLYLLSENLVYQRSAGKYDIRGTTDTLWCDEVFLDALESAKIRYLSGFSVNPLVTMAFCTLSTARMKMEENYMRFINNAHKRIILKYMR